MVWLRGKTVSVKLTNLLSRQMKISTVPKMKAETEWSPVEPDDLTDL